MQFDINKYHFISDRIFDDVLPVYMSELGEIMQTKLYKKGEVLYKEGSLPKYVFRIKRGKVKIEQANEDGNTRIVYIYNSGESFGFRPILCEEKNPVTAVVLENCEIEIYNGKKFLEVAKKSPNLSFNLVEILSFEFNVWINLITSMSHKSAKERIALALLIIHQKYKSEDGTSIITISKLDIAKYAETTEETVVRVLKFYNDQGIIRNNGRKLEVINTQLLEMIAQGF